MTPVWNSDLGQLLPGHYAEGQLADGRITPVFKGWSGDLFDCADGSHLDNVKAWRKPA